MYPAFNPRLSRKEAQAFSTENDNPFASFKPDLKQTGIFIDRFFHKFSYHDLAEKYETTVDDVRKSFSCATKRLIEILAAMDGKKDFWNLDYWKKRVEERSGHIPKGQRWF